MEPVKPASQLRTAEDSASSGGNCGPSWRQAEFGLRIGGLITAKKNEDVALPSQNSLPLHLSDQLAEVLGRHSQEVGQLPLLERHLKPDLAIGSRRRESLGEPAEELFETPPRRVGRKVR